MAWLRIGAIGAAMLAVAGTVLYVTSLQDDNDRLAAELAAAIGERDEARAGIVLRDWSLAVLGEQHAELSKRKDQIRAIRKEIANAPVTTGCAASPAVRIALERLRQLPEANADHPAGAADLQPVADGPPSR
jgi:hypothetical protein